MVFVKINLILFPLRMFEYMLQSREINLGIPIYFIDHSEFITVQCQKILSMQNK